MMEKRRKSPGSTGKAKKKMTKEQLQLAIIRKKECDAKALTIVERLLEADVDPAWLVQNLKHINRCHMEDVIEERAIVRLCGYVLCQKPLTVTYNQRYHISLKDKKVYDISKRKDFCSSSCFGASNYLLEQMLTSPLWLRDQEEIPQFKIFHRQQQISKSSAAHGEVDIVSIGNTQQQGTAQDSSSNKDGQSAKEKLQDEALGQITGCIENFVLEAVQNFELKDVDSAVGQSSTTSDNQQTTSAKSTTVVKDAKEVETDQGSRIGVNDEKSCTRAFQEESGILSNNVSDKDKTKCDEDDDDDIIEQHVYPIKDEISSSNHESSNSLEENCIKSEDTNEQSSWPVEDRGNEMYSTVDSNLNSTDEKMKVQEIKSDKSSNDLKSKMNKKQKQKACENPIDVNLAARVEQSFHEWVTSQTIEYLFGDESVKQRVMNAIDIQENHRILCNKLDRLQFQEEREDAEILSGKAALKPAPHFAVLKEEGQKLDLKVRAFYEGKTTFDEPPKCDDDGQSDTLDTYLPLTDVHAPQTLRRKIFLDKLDHVLLDLLRTLAGNNDAYARASFNYSSARCTAVKALVHTFSLSAKNIIFKTAEWTLVGLVIVKMLSLSDRYLASLLATKQANLYVCMILTAYKLNSDYLNLLVTSFNPNMNPR